MSRYRDIGWLPQVTNRNLSEPKQEILQTTHRQDRKSLVSTNGFLGRYFLLTKFRLHVGRTQNQQVSFLMTYLHEWSDLRERLDYAYSTTTPVKGESLESGKLIRSLAEIIINLCFKVNDQTNDLVPILSVSTHRIVTSPQRYGTSVCS